jgi:thiol-disulfide isomerase/thioredoxin
MRERIVWFVGAGIAVFVAVAFVVALNQTEDADTSAADVLTEIQQVTSTGTALPTFVAETPDTAIGMTAPGIDGRGFTGNRVSTGPGAPTLAVFLAHWCQHCQYEVPQLVNWGASSGFPANLDVVAVTTSTDPTAPNYPPSRWLAVEKWPPLWPVLADDNDGSAAKAFGLSGFPFLVLTDADGKVLWRHSGRISQDDLTATVDALLAN